MRIQRRRPVPPKKSPAESGAVWYIGVMRLGTRGSRPRDQHSTEKPGGQGGPASAAPFGEQAGAIHFLPALYGAISSGTALGGHGRAAGNAGPLGPLGPLLRSSALVRPGVSCLSSDRATCLGTELRTEVAGDGLAAFFATVKPDIHGEPQGRAGRSNSWGNGSAGTCHAGSSRLSA